MASFGEFLSIEGSYSCVSCHSTLPLIACTSSMLRKSSGDDVLQIYSTQQSADNITASSDSVETPAESAGKPTTQPTVAKSASPVSTNVAVASFQLQQQLLLNTLFMNHTQVSAIAWHPTEKILALGCRNGSVLLWTNGDDYDLVDLKNYKLTSAPVTALAWNEQTSHLAIADQAGAVVICRLLSDQPNSIIKIFPLSCMQPGLDGPLLQCISLSTRQSVSGDYKTTRDMFLIVTQNGQLYTINENCDVQDCGARFQSAIAAMAFDGSTGRLLVITEDCVITQFATLDTKLFMEREVKLSFGARAADGPRDSLGRASAPTSIHAVIVGRGLVAISYSGAGIRLLDYLNDESADITPAASDLGAPYRITCLDYEKRTNCLAAGVDSGHLLLIHGSLSHEADSLRLLNASWEPSPKINIGGLAESIEFGSSGMVVAVKKKNGLKLIGKQVMRICMAGNIVALQTAPSQVTVMDIVKKAKQQSGSSLEIRLDHYVKDIFVSHNFIMLRLSDGTLAIYNIIEDFSAFERVSSLSCPSSILAFDQQSIFAGRRKSVDICNFQGVVKQTLQLDDQAGHLQFIKVFKQFLIVITTNSLLKIFDLSRREARLHWESKNLSESIGGDKIITACTNCTGSMIGLISAQSQVKKSVYFYDIIQEKASLFELEEMAEPLDIFWDFDDHRLVAIETALKSTGDSNREGRELLILWAASEQGVHLHNKLSFNQADAFVGINTPYLVYSKRKSSSLSEIVPILLSDFEDIDFLDAQTVKAILDFGFFLNIGNLDEALKSAKYVKGYAAWNNISKTCVHSGRLDIAKICLGSIGKARALYAIRSLPDDDDLRLGRLAICLGMPDFAEKRLNDTAHEKDLAFLYQMEGKWEKALEISRKKSQIKFKSALYKYAKYSEEIGDLNSAIIAYEKSGSASNEVPRMLLQYPDKFHDYLSKTKDKAMRKWYGAFLEACGSLDDALSVYESCHEYLAAVRILCRMDSISSAKKLAEKSNDLAACFHLARYFETHGQVREAVEWFAKAHCIRHAVRLAKQHGMNDELIKLALTAKKELIVEIAQYFEDSGNMDKAASLFFKGGDVSRAVHLCFQTKHYAMLEVIAAELPENVDVKTLEICCEFFLDNKEYGKAANVLVRSNKIEDALRLCVKSNIVITEEMADKMLERAPDEKKQKYLLAVADACDSQGSFHLASKNYTQAGDRLSAIKALIKSGDAEKVKFFASVSGSKQPEIYIIAANFLQTQNWHENGELLKSIITFYTKAKAFDTLSGFYELCAQAEIDDYSNYEKALAACKEALKCLTRPTGTDGPTNLGGSGATPILKTISSSSLQVAQKKTERLHLKIDFLTRFVNARKMASSDFTETIKICRELLNNEPREAFALAVRIGDVYGLMIEGYFVRKENEKAKEVLREMICSVPEDSIKYYVDSKILEQLQYGNFGSAQANSSATTQEDPIEEDIRQ